MWFKIVLFGLCLVSATLSQDSLEDGANDDGKEFDFLLFTQRWPETTCYEWMKRNHKNTCRLPSAANQWTIHGIWPTRNGTKDGPFYCNRSLPFDISQVEAIEPKLNEFWTNVEKGTPEAGLWKHEWEKHGTCAMVLPPFHSEDFYFGQGLNWLQTYSMGPLLARNGITPNSSVYVGQIHRSIFKELNVNPVIECLHESKQQYITEIRICFDKNLKLRDCDGAVGVQTGVNYMSFKTTERGTMITNCDPMKFIQYPSEVPKITREAESESRFPYVKLYRIVMFLRWFTF